MTSYLDQALNTEHDYVPVTLAVRLSCASGHSLLLPCDFLSEDRVAGSDGTNPLDRLQVLVGGENVWVERRDVFHDDGELVFWAAR